MGYLLKPRNKQIKSIRLGAFSWPIILQDTGAGYILGYGRSKDISGYVYYLDNIGSPVSNGGYKVKAKEAKAMAMVFRGYLSVQRFVNKEWDALDEHTRNKEEQNEYKRKAVTTRFLETIEALADFMEVSKGFTIH